VLHKEIVYRIAGIAEDITERKQAELLEKRHMWELAHISRLEEMGRMAAKLGISPRTVEAHRSRIKKKLGVKTLPEVVRIVLSRKHSI